MSSFKIVSLLLGLLLLAGCSSKTEYHAKNVIAQLEEKPVTRKKPERRIALSSATTEGSITQERTQYGKVVNDTFNFPAANRTGSNDIVLIIGIAEYDANPAVKYADNSAYAFKELARRTLGIPKENILMLLNDEATSGKIKSRIALAKELAESSGNLYFYYAGHGVPAKDGNTYLLPYDMRADEIHMEPNLMMDTIYRSLESSRAKNIFVFADTCFSGKDDSGKLLYEGVAPVLKVKKTSSLHHKTTLLSAGGPTDFANDYTPKKQRMFTYFLIKSIINGDKDVGRIYENLRKNVKRASLHKGLGYKQVPQLLGNRHRELY